MNAKLIFVLCVLKLVSGQEESDVCPKSEDIAPCTCDLEGLACFNAKDEKDLQRAFSRPTKYNAYRQVWIHGTNIAKLTSNVFNGQRISGLNLDHNKISYIADDAFGATAQYVRHIGLADNQLTTFPFKESFTRLQKLSLRNNKIQKIPDSAFKNFRALTLLDLSNNEITEIGQFAFDGLYSLEGILLTNNKLKKLGEFSLALSPLASPKIILNDNQISNIARTAFDGGNPMAVSLQNNRLTYLDQYIFLPLLKRMISKNKAFGILVSGNPLTCNDCYRYEWLLKIQNVADKIFLDFKCLNGLPLRSLTRRTINC